MNDIKCQICGSTDTRLHHDQGYRCLYRCRGCGLVFVDPLPNWEEKEAIETQAFDAEMLTDTVEFFDAYGADFREDNVIKAFRRAVELLTKMSGVGNGPRKILDVGPGTGVFLHLCREAGWEPLGIDITERSAKTAKTEFDISVDVGNFFHHPYEPEFFDCISMNDVLEHSLDPVAFLERAYKLLKPGGLISIAVPNQNSLFTLLVDLWVWLTGIGKSYLLDRLYVAPHLYYFGPRQLRSTMERAGFTVTHLEGGNVALERYKIPAYVRLASELVLRTGALIGMSGRVYAIGRKPD
jgi:2-polyprenyl-3-methyl-5-hydroxy-6-metoxy-1,4-benzoquinol methylase